MGRILGMGDVLSFIEKLRKEVDKEKAEEDAERFLEGKFDLEDFFRSNKTDKKFRVFVRPNRNVT